LSRIRSVVLGISVLLFIACLIFPVFLQLRCPPIPLLLNICHFHLLHNLSTRFHISSLQALMECPYLGHASLTLEATSHTVVDTLWLPPRRVYAHKPVTLVAVEPGCLCLRNMSDLSFSLGFCAPYESASRLSQTHLFC